MDEIKQEDELMQKAKEVLAADNKPMQEESPLERAERLNNSTREMMERMEKHQEEYERIRANDQMSGKGSLVRPPRTQKEKDEEEARAMAKNLLGR